MRTFLVFSAFLAAALLAAAALFYPAWVGVSAFTDLEPHKVLPRLAKLLAVVTIVCFLKRMDLWDRQLLGYGVPRARFLRDLAAGWLAGLLTMLVPLALLMLLGVREPDPDGLTAARLAQIAAKAVLAGLAVGFIEETFFRGALYAGLRRESGLYATAVLSALLYAALHFIRPQDPGADAAMGWTSGFPLLFGAFHQFGTLAIWDSFVALTAAGVFLALLRARHGSIALAVGVHAGWVTTIKVTRQTTDSVDDAPLAFLTGTYDHVIGWLAAAWLLLLVLLIAPAAKAGDRDRT
jgi:membrane protease YdiL (CAAX protease family)